MQEKSEKIENKKTRIFGIIAKFKNICSYKKLIKENNKNRIKKEKIQMWITLKGKLE